VKEVACDCWIGIVVVRVWIYPGRDQQAGLEGLNAVEVDEVEAAQCNCGKKKTRSDRDCRGRRSGHGLSRLFI
jgi:hypothetical protein